MAEETPRKTVDELRKIFDLSGKVAVVTGAGGTLGHALSKGLAAFGADVACWDIKTDIMEDVVSDIQGLGRKATASAVANPLKTST
jgi:NAD(P)-dependent dehydrogenase (short-subunit alcohol dehydrogenase family)